MARAWKQWGWIAASILALAHLAEPAQAQLLKRLGLFSSSANNDQPAFGGPAPDQGPDFPNPGAKEPCSPYSLSADNVPNGFEDWPDSRFIEPDPYRFTIRGEYLNYRFKNGNLSTTLVTGSQGLGGASLQESNTQVLLGAGPYDLDRIEGGRATVGIALGVIPPLEVSGFWFKQGNVLFSQHTDGSDILGRPLFLTDLSQEGAALAGFPNTAMGSIEVSTDLSFWSVTPNIIFNLAQTNVMLLDALVGYRYAYFGEDLRISNTLASIDPGVAVPYLGQNQPLGNSTFASDFFRTKNEFNGANLALRGVLNIWRFNIMSETKLGIGSTNQTLEISGQSALAGTNASARGLRSITPGGILALASNSGTLERNELTIIPEFNIHLGYQISRNLRVFVGYNIIYWSDVLRPGDHLNNVVDSRQIPTSINFAPGFYNNPRVFVQPTDFWAHGFNVGVEFSF